MRVGQPGAGRIPAGVRPAGFTLVELLVVLAVMAILGVLATFALGNQGGSETRTLLDDLEGTLLGAQQLCSATSQDVTLAAQGNWDPSGTPLSLCRVTGLNPSASAISAQQSLPETFKLKLLTVSGTQVLSRESQFAGVVAAAGTGSSWWGVAGTGNQAITQVAPFNDPSTGFQGILTAGGNLFQGGAAVNETTLSGLSGRFNGTFYIEVVGLRGGLPYAGSPMGLLVVQANGATVYKFYNPGVVNGNGKWRRI